MNIQSVVLAAVAGFTLAASSLSGQTAEPQAAAQKAAKWELLVPGGALMPTGAQRDAIRSANITAVQLSYVARPAVAITSTFGWARSRDVAMSGAPKLDVFTYDLGAELRAPRWKKGFTPFVGGGAGGRSYNHRKLDVEATHNLAAYGSVGGELGIRRVAIRVEARDYVAGFKPLNGAGASRTGNDVVVMAGLRLLPR